MSEKELTVEEVLKGKQTTDSNSIASLTLTQKALSDVSCLGKFSSLERLDLTFNNLTSLEGLRSCVNLKWLSVVQNKLQSLKGVEALAKLTVLNAGKNKLKSMDEVGSLVSLRALILNDNEIVSICGLDQMKELNTLVLSRNPIREFGESLAKAKSITKLSLSNCQICSIGSSLKKCKELKELRLAHNDIKDLPLELAYNKKIQNLDLGNNGIARWSDVKVLNSLVDLKNLNLRGNPIAENDKSIKKIQKALPRLHVFNAKPMDKKNAKNGKSSGFDRGDDFSLVPDNELDQKLGKGKTKDHTGRKHSSNNEMDQGKINDRHKASDLHVEKDLKQTEKKPTNKHLPEEEAPVDETGMVKKPKRKKSPEEENNVDVEDSKQKRGKRNEELPKKDVRVLEDGRSMSEKEPKSKKSRKDRGELDIIDDGEASFADLIAVDAVEGPKNGENKVADKPVECPTSQDVVVTFPGKKKKSKNSRTVSTIRLPASIEIGTGGSSTWGDE